MRTTIDAAGRLVVPKVIRERLQLRGGQEVEIDERHGVIEIVPAPAEVTLVESAEGPVAVPSGDLPPLTDADVKAALDATRR